jgi:hypothetical protein
MFPPGFLPGFHVAFAFRVPVVEGNGNWHDPTDRGTSLIAVAIRFALNLHGSWIGGIYTRRLPFQPTVSNSL